LGQKERGSQEKEREREREREGEIEDTYLDFGPVGWGGAKLVNM
jgi:hypothetical protein